MNTKTTDTAADDIYVDLYIEYEKKVAEGKVTEVMIDSKQQEIDLSEYNELTISDEPSNDEEDSFISQRIYFE